MKLYLLSVDITLPCEEFLAGGTTPLGVFDSVEAAKALAEQILPGLNWEDVRDEEDAPDRVYLMAHESEGRFMGESDKNGDQIQFNSWWIDDYTINQRFGNVHGFPPDIDYQLWLKEGKPVP